MVAYGTILLAFATGSATLWAIYDRIGLRSREHYDVLKENCLKGIDNQLRTYYMNTFTFSNVEFGYGAYNRATFYYQDKITTNKPKYQRPYKFTFVGRGLEVDPYYYDDLPNHFNGLKNKLTKAEHFINKYDGEVKKHAKDLFDRITNNSEFKSFVSKEMERTKINEQQITTDCLTFMMNSIFTRDKVMAASYTGMMQNYEDGVEKCYKIAMKYKNNHAVKELRVIESKAKRIILEPLGELDILLKRTILQGTCPYIA
jgi:hypothetical protein